MEPNIQKPLWLCIMVALLLLVLSGCNDAGSAQGTAKPQSAMVSTFADLSGSTGLMNPNYADAAIKRVGSAVVAQQLGDRFRVASFGERRTDRALGALSIATNRKLRLPAARRQVEETLRGLLDSSRQSGGDGSTNLLYTLENAQPVCTPRSKVFILSDGIEDSEAYSVPKALTTGQPVRLPPPTSPYLKGCAVEFIGIGISPQAGTGVAAETLPNDKLQALIAGWREYFAAAGVRADDMRFQSIL